MKMLKKIAIPMLLITAIFLTLALTSCKKECAHEYGDWTVTKEATCTENGEQQRVCSICGVPETQVITAEGHKTDDLLCGTCGETIVGVEALFPTLDPETTSVGVVLKDFVLVGEETVEIKLAEALLYLTEDGTPAIYADGEATVTYDGLSATASMFVFTEGATIYATQSMYETSYFEVPLDVVLESNTEALEMLAMVKALLPSIETWLNESLIPCFKTPTLPEDVELPEVNEDTAKKAATAILDLFFTVKATDDGATVALDLSIIKDVNNALNEKTVAQLIDAVAGEGKFLQLQDLIPRALNYSVKDFISFVSVNLGVDVPALLTSLDELAVIISGNEEATLEMMLGMEGNIEDLLANEEFLAITVRDLLIAALELEDEASLEALIAEVVATLSTNTVYQLIGVDAEIPAQINQAVDMISSMLTYEINVGKDGKFVNSVLKFNEADMGISITAVITAEKITVDLGGESGMLNGQIEIIPGYTTTLDTERMEEVKAVFTLVPEITVETLENEDLFKNGYRFFPVYEGEKLVGAYVWDTNYVLEENEYDSTIYNLSVYSIRYYDLTAITQIEVVPGCSGMIEVSYAVKSYSTNSHYTVAKEVFDALDDPTEYVAELINSSRIDVSYMYEIPDQYITVDYDPNENAYVEDSSHHYIYVEDESILPEDVNCGEFYKEVYACDCGSKVVDNIKKQHGEECVISAIETDETCTVLYITYNCTCGEHFTDITVYLEGDVTFAAKSVVGDEGDPFDIGFTVTTPGSYTISISGASNDGYLHVYQNSWIDSVSFHEYSEDSVTFDFEESDIGYFNLYFYDYNPEESILIKFSFNG